jgi:hypothetical protein
LAGFEREIEREYAVSKKNYKSLLALQEKIMLSTTRLYNARMGDRAELETMLEEEVSLKHYIPSGDKAIHANLAAAENYLLGQLKEIDMMLTQLDDQKSEYISLQDELISWRTQLDEKILIARTSMTIWARAHKNLGAGVPVPPMIDVSGIASNLAGNAAKAVIP